MKKVEISYNPYKMITTVLIDGVDVCKDGYYDKFREFIKNEIPLQTWIEPIPYMDWAGFVNEISDPEINDEVMVTFSGRVIDFEDLKRSIADQNDERSSPVIYHFKHKKVLDDKVLSTNIEDVVKELKSDRFHDLVAQRTTEGLTQKYNDLDENYTIAKESVFYIVLAGVYSSGKSTLLNALIRHDVLPTSTRTCTSKNCRIRHDRSLGSKLSLVCYDEDENVVVEKRTFDNDADCANAFLEICPIKNSNSEDNYPDVSMMELGVDLSHLYPSSVSEDKFTIVLIDTPGMDSAQSSEDGINKHAEIALDAISMESKPMIILCVDGQKYEDTSIGEFMREIIAQAKEEGSGFNDRFLFLMNKSDMIPYKQSETPNDVRTAFAKYLTDNSKWNIKGDEEELQQLSEAASHFVPRVFMTAAAPALAITSNLAEIPEEEIDDDHYHLREAYESFKKKVLGRRFPEKYYLARYCDIPNYRKDEIEKEFDAAIDNENDVRAAELQCGLVSVESAIKDYIERYAYPIKVRGLLETFEDILEDVSGFSSGVVADLRLMKNELGERNSERREASKTKESVEGKIAALEKAKAKIDVQLKKLDGIKFDEISLKKAISEFRADIEENSEIQFIRKNPKVMTGQRSPSDVMDEINRRMDSIKCLFDKTLRKTNHQLEGIKKKHDQQLVDIFSVLKSTIAELENSGVFKQGEYSFKDSVLWKMSFENIDADSFASDIKKSVVERKSGTKPVHNYKKDEWRSSWNPFKKLGSLFMSETKTVPYHEDGYYKTTDLVQSLDTYLRNLQTESNAMISSFKEIMDDSKKRVRDLTNRLLKEIQQFLNDIKTQEDRIQSLSSSMEKLQEEITKSEKTSEWLNELAEKIKGA